MILKVVIVKVTGSNPVCASIINKLTYKHMGHPKFLSCCNNLINVGDIYANTVEEAEHVALLNHIKYDIITVTEFLK